MTQPRLAHQTAYGRMYARSLNDQPSVPSITTVIGRQANDMTGWAGHMAATHLAGHPDLPNSVGRGELMRPMIRESASAAERYRTSAAERGDRVHHYCEQLSLRQLGRDHRWQQARDDLESHGELRFADRIDEWWEGFDVEPIAAEVTVWNHDVGYAGTLDLVAKIGGRVCLIDFKTKGTDRDGFVKALDDKVVMQLVAGMKAQETLVDAQAGTWEPFAWGENPLLMPVAIGETEVRAMRARPDSLKDHWALFCSLRRVWEAEATVSAQGRALLACPPPPRRNPSPPTQSTSPTGSTAVPSAATTAAQ